MMAMVGQLPLLPLLVGVPLIAAVFCLLFSRYRWVPAFSVAIAAIQLSGAILLTLKMQESSSTLRYSLAGWGAPLGIDLAVDGLSTILLLVTAFLTFAITLYSTWYFSRSDKAARFWPLWWLLVAGLNAAFLAADAFNIYVALEMIGLSAVALVALANTRAALTAALRYAIVGLLGSLCYLLGVAFLYREYGTLDLVQLSAVVEAGPLSWASLCLISVGLLLKTALLPLHFWLPPAHASAPAPVSAVLSALVVKASFYLLVRFWLDILDPAVTEIAANFLGILGTIAIIWGCIEAYRATRLKMLVAYSTVAQLGYLFLLFPLAIASGSSELLGTAAMAAVVYFIIAHALAKSAMFLAAGNILDSLGHDELNRLRGLARSHPLPLITFAIAGVSLIGLPPSGGFIAKWLLLNAAIDTAQWWWFVVMLVGGLLATLYIGRVIAIAFAQDTDEVETSAKPTSGAAVCGFALAISVVVLGFNAEWILNLLGDGTVSQITDAGAPL